MIPPPEPARPDPGTPTEASGSAFWTGTTRACADPDCTGTAQPQVDGTLGYHECPLCGYTFGWTRAVNNTPGCPVGIAQDTRARAARMAGTDTGALYQIGRPRNASTTHP